MKYHLTVKGESDKSIAELSSDVLKDFWYVQEISISTEDEPKEMHYEYALILDSGYVKSWISDKEKTREEIMELVRKEELDKSRWTVMVYKDREFMKSFNGCDEK